METRSPTLEACIFDRMVTNTIQTSGPVIITVLYTCYDNAEMFLQKATAEPCSVSLQEPRIDPTRASL